MTNLEVAECFVENALAYSKSGDLNGDAESKIRTLTFRLSSVVSNLEYIKKLLEKPNEENEDHDWNDFK